MSSVIHSSAAQGMAGPPADMAAVAEIDRDIAELEARLEAAKLRRQQMMGDEGIPTEQQQQQQQRQQQRQQQQQHFLLLLSDSALPLGSFAFSSGLESFLAHDKAAQGLQGGQGGQVQGGQGLQGQAAFGAFLPLSVASYAHSSLPFVLAGHAAAISPTTTTSLTSTLATLDDTYDATIICTVGRRASVAQGRALLSVWERAFAPMLADPLKQEKKDPLRAFAQLVKRSAHPAATTGTLPAASAHLPPLFGAVAALAGLDRQQAADVFVLAHVKALVSAAVRANLLGPYQAQKLLASAHVQELVVQAVAGAWDVAVADAGQTVPVVDLWMGRHEMLYSRIFNS